VSDTKTRHVWITKHALTDGIIECDAEVDEDGDAWVQVEGHTYRQLIRRSEVSYSLAAAQKRAEEKRVARVNNLRAHADRLESKQIKVVTK
jgi:ABC-type phosphate transport system auxiliary subunit